jgi:hypothetical protein
VNAQLIQNKVELPRNLSQLPLPEVLCFESTENCAQHCFKNEYTLEIVLSFDPKCKQEKLRIILELNSSQLSKWKNNFSLPFI